MKREGVRSVPSFHYFKNGEKVDVVNGANAEAIEAAIKKHAWVTIGAGVLLKGEMNFTTRGDAGVLERRNQSGMWGVHFSSCRMTMINDYLIIRLHNN